MKTISKSEQLKRWMKKEKVFPTSTILWWGYCNHYNRADRTKRDFLQQGLIRRLTDTELKRRRIKSVEGWYKWIT